MSFSIVIYSHTDYSDIWPLCFGQADKYFPKHKKYLFVNQASEIPEDGWWKNNQCIFYDDKLPYKERVVHCLSSVEDKVVLFMHEDMFLYNSPDINYLSHLSAKIQQNQIDVVKLCRASYNEHVLVETGLQNVYQNPDNLKFAIQPSLCSREKLIQVYDKTYGKNIWDFERNSSGICELLNIKTGMVYSEGDVKVGEYHWSSQKFPYVATAVEKGKWNFAQYKEILEQLFSEYGYKSQRGTNEV